MKIPKPHIANPFRRRERPAERTPSQGSGSGSAPGPLARLTRQIRSAAQRPRQATVPSAASVPETHLPEQPVRASTAPITPQAAVTHEPESAKGKSAVEAGEAAGSRSVPDASSAHDEREIDWERTPHELFFTPERGLERRAVPGKAIAYIGAAAPAGPTAETERQIDWDQTPYKLLISRLTGEQRREPLPGSTIVYLGGPALAGPAEETGREIDWDRTPYKLLISRQTGEQRREALPGNPIVYVGDSRPAEPTPQPPETSQPLATLQLPEPIVPIVPAEPQTDAAAEAASSSDLKGKGKAPPLPLPRLPSRASLTPQRTSSELRATGSERKLSFDTLSPHSPLDAPPRSERSGASGGSRKSYLSTSLGDAFPTTFEEYEARLAAQAERPIDTKILADLLNEVRLNPASFINNPDGDTIPHGARLIDTITDDHIDRWMKGLGVKKEQYQDMLDMARRAGRWIPSSSTFCNVFSYALFPALKFPFPRLGSPGAQAGMVIPWASVVQPMFQTPVQSAVIATLDFWRHKGKVGNTLDKNAFNLAETHEAIQQRVHDTMSTFNFVRSGLDETLDEISRSCPDAKIPAAGNEVQLIDRLDPAFRAASDTQKAALRTRIADMAKLTTTITESITKLLSLEQQGHRQYVSQLSQIAPRALRAASSLPGTVAHFYGNWSAGYVTLLSSCTALLFQGLQHYYAGDDEVEATKTEIVQNILGAQILNAEGKEAWKKGEPIKEEHFNHNAARALVDLPETAIMRHIASLLGKKLKPLEAKLAAMVAERSERQANPAAALSSSRFRATTPMSTLQANIAETEAQIEVEKKDLQYVKAGKLSKLSKPGQASSMIQLVMAPNVVVEQPDVGPQVIVDQPDDIGLEIVVEEPRTPPSPSAAGSDSAASSDRSRLAGMAGHAYEYFKSAMSNGSFRLVSQEVYWKFTSLEVTAQYAQRQAQTLTFGALGAAGATAGGRLANALIPGVTTSPGAQIGLNVASGMIGTFAAWTQWSAIIIKNIRRGSDGNVSFLSQLWEGIYAPLALRWKGQAAEKAKTVAVEYLNNLGFDPHAFLDAMNDENVASLVANEEFRRLSNLVMGSEDDPLVGSSAERGRLFEIPESDISDFVPGAFSPRPRIETGMSEATLELPPIDEKS
jgi:hypothetical protein